ncbi:MAG: nucleoside triphosphate pyrophosphohydrolase [Oscillospiraceae bacterium]|nr:nucleoside triphosphate pyrophosphohydrolase [Oscillospiraceae bacterium]
MDFEFKNRYGINDLLKIMKILRSENGCPWDKVQTHESIRTDLIEECYEVCEGIDKNDPEILKEELGDMLLQIVFHTEIEAEQKNFDFDDVCNDICQKLIYRHPHVFGEGEKKIKADTEDEVLKNWDALKKESKKQNTYTETLESVPKTLPALLRGEKVCKRAARAGLPINNAEDCIKKIQEQLGELGRRISLHNNTEDKGEVSEDFAQNQQILGEILFGFCNLNRILKNDGEKALTYSINRFIMAFRAVENDIITQGGSLDKLSNDELDRLAYKVISGMQS